MQRGLGLGRLTHRVPTHTATELSKTSGNTTGIIVGTFGFDNLFDSLICQGVPYGTHGERWG